MRNEFDTAAVKIWDLISILSLAFKFLLQNCEISVTRPRHVTSIVWFVISKFL